MAELFQSFWQGGFECSTHRVRDGRRLDLIAATGHDRAVAEDYRRLRVFGIKTVRDGLRWHCIEKTPGRYDWQSFLPFLHAARTTGTEVIWDLCHYGYPDDLDVFSGAFVERFARYAGAVARLVRGETDARPWYCPINEISYWAWAGGSAARMNPFARERADELKCQLARAAITAAEAIWAVDGRARIVHIDPVIHVAADPARPEDRAAAEGYRLAQYQGWDMLAGLSHPELGGSARQLDVIGINYYHHNQWIFGGPTLDIGDPPHRPLRDILREVHRRYDRPVYIAETSIEAERRPAWLAYVVREARAALAAGVPVVGLCWYPILCYPDWDDGRHCATGLFGHLDGAALARPLYAPLAAEWQRQRALFPQPPESPPGWTARLEDARA